MLKPLFERMRTQGPDFLEKNAALGEEVRRTFADIDRIERELKKAARAITSASGLVAKYREADCRNSARVLWEGKCPLEVNCPQRGSGNEDRD